MFCLLAFPAILRLIKTFIDIRTSKLTKTFNMEITSDFYNHVMNMDYATVENPEIQSIKERASDTLVKVADVSTGMTTLISAVISLLLISSIISVLNPLIILLVILILIINSAVTKKVNYKNHIIGMELSKNDLFLWAYSYMMGHLSYAQEVRLFKLNKLLMDFMDMSSGTVQTGDMTPVFDKNSVIEFRNVSFAYPGTERYVLKNLNLSLRGDEKLCIVGVNGAGKSTFIKLLTRLYNPTEGEILLNRINIKEYDYDK